MLLTPPAPRRADVIRINPIPGAGDGRFGLPGPLSATRMLEGQDACGRPFGVIHDPGVNTFTVVLECEPDGGAPDLMTEVVTAYPAASSSTSTYVTLSFHPGAGGSRPAGSRLAGKGERAAEMTAALAVRVPPLAATLSAAGAGAAWPLPPDRIADPVRINLTDTERRLHDTNTHWHPDPPTASTQCNCQYPKSENVTPSDYSKAQPHS